MALTRAQLLAGDSTQGVVLANEVQGVKQGTGVSISADGTLSFDPSTASGILLTNNVLAYNTYVWPTQGPTGNGQILLADSGGNLSWTINYVATSGVNTAAKIPAGTTAQRPAPADLGSFRYNTQTSALEYYNGSSWVSVGSVGQSILTNNASAFNSYVWPNGDGGLGQFLQTDGSGNLTWADAKGYAVVTVSAQEPSPPDEGELWFDCGTGTLKVYQTCVAPAGWTAAGAGGLAVLPANTTSSPVFTGGTGTSGDPYTLGALSVSTGGSTLVATVTVTNLAPFQSVTVADINGTLNGGRFQFTNTIANSSGVLTFEILFNDVPASAPGASYTPLIKIGDATVFITGTVAVVDALEVTSGSIIGTPFVGQAVNYVTGAATGGLAPYAYTYQWARDGVDIAGATSVTYTPVNADLNKTLSVRITATDSIGGRGSATAQASSVTLAPVVAGNVTSNPAFIGGTGAQTTPYALASANVGAAGSVVVSQITVTNLAPNQQVIVSDVNAAANAGRFTITNDTANGSGTLVFDIVFTDQPSSTSGTNYTATIQIGSQVFIEAPVLVVNALTVTAGVISGIPNVGTAVNYTTGQATGGVAPYTYTYQWFEDGTAIPAATSATYTPGTGQVNKVLSVQITARDALNTTATATATAAGPVAFPAFPSGIWVQNPPNGLQTNPGGLGGTYNGFNSTITTSGCLEASVNGGAYASATQPIAFGDTLEVRWSSAALCGGAASGTTITGDITDGTYQNSYSLTIDRVPASVPSKSVTGVELDGTATVDLFNSLSQVNSTAYITYAGSSTGSNISVSVAGGPFQLLSTSGTGTPISLGESLTVRYDVGSAVSTGYTAIIRIGDGTNAAGSFSQGTVTATTTDTASFPNLALNLQGGPTQIPQSVSGVWADGSFTLIATGCLELSLDDASWSQSLSIADGDTLYLRWEPIGGSCGGAASGTTISGGFSGGVYNQSYSLQLDKNPNSFNIHAATIQPTNTEVFSPVISLSGYNAPAAVTYTPGANTLTDVKVSINGAAFVLVPTSGTLLQVDPGASVQFAGTTGGAISTAYSITVNIGTTTDSWTVTTESALPEIMSPTIVSPAAGATGINPALNDPSAVTVTATAYEGLNGAGVQTGSEWQAYENNFPLQSTNTITNIVNTAANTTRTSLGARTLVSVDASSLNANAALLSSVDGIGGSGFDLLITPFGSLDYPRASYRLGLLGAGSADFIGGSIVVGGPYALIYFNYGPVGQGTQFVTYGTTVSTLTPELVVAGDTPPTPTLGFNQSTNKNSNPPTLRFSQGVWWQTVASSSALGTTTSYTVWRPGLPNNNVWTPFKGSNGGVRVVTGFEVDTGFVDVVGCPHLTMVKGQRSVSGESVTFRWSKATDGINFVIDSVLTQAQDITSLASYDNGVNTVVLAAVFNNNGNTGLYVSTNGGGTFAYNSAANTTIGITAGVASFENGMYVYTDNGVWFTTDGTNFDFVSNAPFSTSADSDFALLQDGSVTWVGRIEDPIAPGGFSINRLKIANSTGQTELVITGAVDDGFQALDRIIANAPSVASGIITELSNTGIKILGDAFAQGWSNGQKVERDPTTYSILPGSPYAGNAGALTSTDIPGADLTESTDVFVRTRYTDGSIFSEYSAWSGFSLAAEFVPNVGQQFGGGYFAGQLNIGGTLYNLIAAPAAGSTAGPDLAGSLQGETTSPATLFWTSLSTTNIPAGLAPSLDDGFANTQDVLAEPIQTSYPLFNNWINAANGPNGGSFNNTNGTGIGGYGDWYLPAYNELELVFNSINPNTTTNSELQQPYPGGQGLTLGNQSYWASSVRPATTGASATIYFGRISSTTNVFTGGSGAAGQNVFKGRAIRRQIA